MRVPQLFFLVLGGRAYKYHLLHRPHVCYHLLSVVRFYRRMRGRLMRPRRA